MKIIAEIARTNEGYEDILYDGILTADCDLENQNYDEKLGHIISYSIENEISFRIYRTFAGFRLICVNYFFRPLTEITHRILKDIDCDPRYSFSIFETRKFSCRITPKPSRIGMEKPNFYSFFPKQQNKWIEEYNLLSLNYKTCDFILQTFECEIAPQIQNFIKLHDEKSGCSLDLPLA